MSNNNQIQARQDAARKDMMLAVKQMSPAIKKALPSVITPERFTRMVYSAMSSTPQLCECTQSSFLGAMMQAAQLGVEPNTPLGQAYILPYRNKGKLEAQFQLGYKGMIDLAYRSEEVSIIQAHVVYANDVFEYAYGLEPTLRHIPAARDRGEATHVYAMYKTKAGGFGFEVMSMEDARMHGQRYSKSFSSSFSPWKTNFEEMAKKTVLKKVLKYAPMKSDFKRAFEADETIKSALEEDMSFVPDETVYETTGEVVEESPAEEPQERQTETKKAKSSNVSSKDKKAAQEPPQVSQDELDREMDEIFG